MTDNLRIETRNGVMEITIARPEKKNALTGEMYLGLVDAMEWADTSDDVRAILISGEGENFSAGSDIGEFLSRVNQTEEFPALRFIRQLAICEKPMVAAVDGNTIGVGTTMLFHCDLIYASPVARFHTPFINLALVPEAASSLLLPARTGHARAAEMLLLGEPFSADQALSLGLINEIAPAGEVLGVAREKASLLASKPRNALRVTRRLMRGDPDILLDRIREEAFLFDKALRSEEAREVFMAFMARSKSKPA